MMSWNVNGLRALLKLEGFSALQLAQREDFDVLCLQETKLQARISKFCSLDCSDSVFWDMRANRLLGQGTSYQRDNFLPVLAFK